MRSKLPNLLPLEAYSRRGSFLREVAGIALFYGCGIWLIDQWEGRDRGVFSFTFKVLFFAFFMTLVGRIQGSSHWESLFYESGRRKLAESPRSGDAYQLVCDRGIMFFSADGLRFVPVKVLWRRSTARDISPLNTVTARQAEAGSLRNWRHRLFSIPVWPAVEINSDSGKLVVRVPDASEAVAQINRAVETLLASAR